jgi:hypothetical protein
LGLLASALTLWACAKGVNTTDPADAGAATGGTRGSAETGGSSSGVAGATGGGTLSGGSGGGTLTDGSGGGTLTGGTSSTSSPSCVDGVMNGLETDVDCGQVCLTRCALGRRCELDADCAQGECNNGICGYCGNGVLDGDETDVDCGGSCLGCLGDACSIDLDCAASNVCGPTGLCTHCGNGISDGDEVGEDCGGSCPGCYGDACVTDDECATGLCIGEACNYDHCVAGWETDPLGLECQQAQPGGPNYQSDRVECADILMCYMVEDCGPGTCPAGMCLPQSGTAAQAIAENVYAAMCP